MIQIQGYEILNPLGIGGMGEVYLANQLATNQRVALKVLLPEYVSDPDFNGLFLREGQITAGLNHPHIVTIFDVGESGGVPYLAMEYLPAGDLKAMLTSRSNKFMVMRAIHQIAGALAYTHGLGVIHGDVKPQNILFQDVGRAVLTDFGTANEKRDILRAQKSSYIMGSPIYISPEQVMGERPSHLSDIYSLGVILFEALAGYPPFLADSPVETARLRLSAVETPKLPEEFLDYQRFIDAMLELDPKDRRMELSEFINDFQAVMQGNDTVEMDKTQRLSMDNFVERQDGDFFYIAPKNVSQGQEPTQQIPVAGFSMAEVESQPQEYAQVSLAGAGSSTVAVTEKEPPTSASLAEEAKPLKEWVTTEDVLVADEIREGKLNDLVFFLQDCKQNFKENAKIRAQNYPNAHDIDQLLRPVKDEVKKQTFVFADKISKQTKLWFIVGLLFICGGTAGLVLSTDTSPALMKETVSTGLEAAKPVLTVAGTTAPGPENSQALWSISEAEQQKIATDENAKPVSSPAAETIHKSEVEPVIEAVQQIEATETELAVVDDIVPRPENSQALWSLSEDDPQKISMDENAKPVLIPAAETSHESKIKPVIQSVQQIEASVIEDSSPVVSDDSAQEPAPVTTAMLDEVAKPEPVNTSAAGKTLEDNATLTSKLNSGVVNARGNKIINQQVEDALGKYVGWMIRNNDGSLSLFIDWVDLVEQGASNDFSAKAKKSLNVLAYIIRNYDGFSIAISDHSNRQKTVSVSRAHKVLNYLIVQGVPAERVQTASVLGEITGNVEMRLTPVN